MEEQQQNQGEPTSPGTPAEGDAKEKLLAEAQAHETEEKEALHNLFEQAVGLRGQKPKDEAPPADPDTIARISSADIKSMRNVTAKQVDPEAPVTDAIVTSLIKIYYDIIGMFTVAKGRDRCLVNGHECKHCGGI